MGGCVSSQHSSFFHDVPQEVLLRTLSYVKASQERRKFVDFRLVNKRFDASVLELCDKTIRLKCDTWTNHKVNRIERRRKGSFWVSAKGKDLKYLPATHNVNIEGSIIIFRKDFEKELSFIRHVILSCPGIIQLRICDLPVNKEFLGNPNLNNVELIEIGEGYCYSEASIRKLSDMGVICEMLPSWTNLKILIFHNHGNQQFTERILSTISQNLQNSRLWKVHIFEGKELPIQFAPFLIRFLQSLQSLRRYFEIQFKVNRRDFERVVEHFRNVHAVDFVAEENGKFTSDGIPLDTFYVQIAPKWWLSLEQEKTDCTFKVCWYTPRY